MVMSSVAKNRALTEEACPTQLHGTSLVSTLAVLQKSVLRTVPTSPLGVLHGAVGGYKVQAMYIHMHVCVHVAVVG